ncbi:HECT-type E3 ubiquitin transferase [Ranunculus cassubicifolius]
MAEPRKTQVSMRGASAKEISRDDLIDKVSKERELRNYSRKSSAAALFIQRVWRRYNVTKKVAMEIQQEWELLINHPNLPITTTWVSNTLLRPFLFFHQQTTNRRCMLICFKTLLQSINSADTQKNFCSLTTGSLEERSVWLHQSHKLILICMSVLAEFSCSSPGGQDTGFLTLVMRITISLTDVKGWKWVTKDNFGDADLAVKDLIKRIATGKHSLYWCIRSYITKLDYQNYHQRNTGLQTDDHFLVTASAITVGLRPFQVANLDVNHAFYIKVQDAVVQYCIYLLTVPWLCQRLPTVLLPALKHKSVLSICLDTLLISKEKIFLEMSLLDRPSNREVKIPSVGWALANILNLATESENNSSESGKFSQGINCRVYLHVVTIVAENLLSWLESVKWAKHNHDCIDNANVVNNDPDIWDKKTTFGSLKLSFIDLLKPIVQPWHLLTLLAMTKKKISIESTDISTNMILEKSGNDIGDLKLLDIAYFYSYMLRVLKILNPLTGSLPILNMLSFTPGFLHDLWGALEASVFFESSHKPVNVKSATGGTSSGQNVESARIKQKEVSKDVGNKWASVLQIRSKKSTANAEYGNSIDLPSRLSLAGEDPSEVWDVEPLRQGVQGISNDTTCMLHLFCSTYSHLLLVLDDIEFYDKQVPFSLEQQRRITSMLNTLVYNAISHNNNQQNTPLLDAAIRCLHLLYERDCRRQFCPPNLWLSPARKSRPPIAAAARAHEAVFVCPRSEDSLISPTMGSVITITPHVFPFEERVQMFREFIKLDKVSRRMAGEVVGPGPGSVEIVIRRSHIVEDGFKQLNSLGSKLKSRIHVSFVSESGLPEAGLDYGGLSKEFLTDISKTAFHPGYGLFTQTSTSERHLIPKVSAKLVENGVQMIEFLGRVVGKALYEGILLDYTFSHAFVQKLLGRYSFIDELSTLDPELYKNLMYVKHYEGDIKDLSLDFTVTDEYLGNHIVTELKPGGKDITVTNDNKLQYIHAIADYKLNRQILPLANAFYRGLIDLISPSWISLFNANELNQLLSGGNHDIDVDDLRSNTRYTGGYSEDSKSIKIFWEVFAEFEAKDRCMVLKFVTSCSRAPLLGFKYLHPAFTIHKVSCSVPLWASFGGQDVDRLPSASTCYNTLKLPTYKRGSTLKAKLLYAINSNAGFELS